MLGISYTRFYLLSISIDTFGFEARTFERLQFHTEKKIIQNLNFNFYGTSFNTDSSKTIISLDTFNGVILLLKSLPRKTQQKKKKNQKPQSKKAKNKCLSSVERECKNSTDTLHKSEATPRHRIERIYIWCNETRTIHWMTTAPRLRKVLRNRSDRIEFARISARCSTNYTQQRKLIPPDRPICGLIITQLVSLPNYTRRTECAQKAKENEKKKPLPSRSARRKFCAFDDSS